MINKAVFLALGINTEGQKENEGAKFWLSVLTELKNRGLQDILIACVGGLKGFPDARNSVYPQTHNGVSDQQKLACALGKSQYVLRLSA